MTIKINDKEVILPENCNVKQALEENAIPQAGTAVALNGKVVGKAAYETTILADGDSLLIIKAFYGG